MTLKDQLIQHEGLRLKPYRCTAGKLTIGVGRNLEDTGISEEEAMFLLDNDIARFTYLCQTRIPCFMSLSDSRKNVLVDMAFNMGIAGLLKFQNMLSALEEGDYEKATAEMLNSVWAKQVQPSRVTRLTQMMLGRA